MHPCRKMRTRLRPLRGRGVLGFLTTLPLPNETPIFWYDTDSSILGAQQHPLQREKLAANTATVRALATSPNVQNDDRRSKRQAVGRAAGFLSATSCLIFSPFGGVEVGNTFCPLVLLEAAVDEAASTTSACQTAVPWGDH